MCQLPAPLRHRCPVPAATAPATGRAPGTGQPGHPAESSSPAIGRDLIAGHDFASPSQWPVPDADTSQRQDRSALKLVHLESSRTRRSPPSNGARRPLTIRQILHTSISSFAIVGSPKAIRAALSEMPSALISSGIFTSIVSLPQRPSSLFMNS